jgi:membrane-anchored glycerophosphoryl diester phosphodiesterase (GDPDase)
MKILDYLYYKIYVTPVYAWWRDIPEISTPGLTSILLFSNIIAFSEVMHFVEAFSLLHENPIFGLGIFMILLVIVLVRYNKNKRKEIRDRYSIESKQSKRNGFIAVALYALLSLMLFVFTVLLNKGTA